MGGELSVKKLWYIQFSQFSSECGNFTVFVKREAGSSVNEGMLYHD